MPEHILLAVAWPYANGPRHIGHVAGYGVPSDVFARFQRLRGNHVLMVSGTDEHGTPITYGADREEVPPAELARQRRGADLQGDRAALLRAARLRRAAAGMDRRSDAVASQRAQLLAEL